MKHLPRQADEATAGRKVNAICLGAHAFCENFEESLQIDVPGVQPLFTDQGQHEGDGTVDGVAQRLMLGPVMCSDAHDAIAEGEGFVVLAAA